MDAGVCLNVSKHSKIQTEYFMTRKNYGPEVNLSASSHEYKQVWTVPHKICFPTTDVLSPLNISGSDCKAEGETCSCKFDIRDMFVCFYYLGSLST